MGHEDAKKRKVTKWVMIGVSTLFIAISGALEKMLTVENGACTVEERRISYDAEWLIDQVRQSEQYAAAPVWSEVIFEEWRTCRERVSYFLRHAELFAQSIGDPRRPFMLETWESAWKDWIASGEKP